MNEIMRIIEELYISLSWTIALQISRHYCYVNFTVYFEGFLGRLVAYCRDVFSV